MSWTDGKLRMTAVGMVTVEFIVNGLSLVFVKDTLHLVSLKAADEPWVDNAPAGAAFWQLLAVDREGWRVSLDGGSAQQAEAAMHNGVLSLRWQRVEGSSQGSTGAAGPFDVEVQIKPVPERAGLTAWRIRVDNQAAAWTLWSVTFPLLHGLLPSQKPDADQLFYPEGWGTIRSGWQAMRPFQRRFRGWDFAMQFLGISRDGQTLYLGVHDPRLTTKQFEFSPGDGAAQTRRGRLAVTTFPEGMSQAGNSCRLDYDTVVGAIPGDWYDACGVYGAWARRQPWARRSPGAGTKDSPFEHVEAWHVMHVPARPMEAWAEAMERTSRLLGARLGVHFYNWHRIPFDTSYPDYLPEREGLRELIARLKGVGILTMPYINARIWDINARSWEDRQAARFAAKGSSLRLEPRTLFNYLEEYGSGQKLSPMCPTTTFWQDTVLELCRRITSELGVDGVYLDQVAAEKPELCFDPSHGHPLGGGGFWLEGYRQMVQRIRAALAPDVFLTTECNWEGAIADFDGLLMWHSFGENLVPLFPAVYAGLARTFGCQFHRRDLEEQSGQRFAARMGALLVWGAQLGWGDLTLLLEDAFQPLAAYFARLCGLRAAHQQTFAAGRMLRPPRLEPNGPAIASLWQAADGAITLFLVNPTGVHCEVTAVATAAECTGRAFEAGAADGVHLLPSDAGRPRCRVALSSLAALAIPLV